MPTRSFATRTVLILALCAASLPAPGWAKSKATSKSASTASEPAPATPVMTWQGGQIVWSELSGVIDARLKRLENDYQNERFDTIRSAAFEILDEKLLMAEAQKRGLTSPEALIESVIRDQQVSEEEVKEFFESNRGRFEETSLEAVHDQIEQNLFAMKANAAASGLVEELRSGVGVTMTLKRPPAPRVSVPTQGAPSRGARNPKVTIVEFADYQCPYCARAYQTMKEVVALYPNDVAWVYRDFPLPFHGRAEGAAAAARCAGKQDRYWEMHDLILDNQRALEDSDLAGHAQRLGLNLATWQACTQDPAVAREIAAEKDIGTQVGVVGTPAFFVNGIILNGARPVEDFREIIDAELQEGR